jgi:hypothetical protein
MTRIYSTVANVSWWLGLLSLIWAVIVRVAPQFAGRMHTTSRGWLIGAGAVFLCSIASREMERSASLTMGA